MTELADIGASEACAYTDPRPPRSPNTNYLCERDAGHYPASPHGAFLGDDDRPPLFWNNAGQETDEDGVALDPLKPLPVPLVRAEVEAKLAQRGVGVNGADLLMTYVALVVERLFGDMDAQPRLELESAYAGLARQRLESTMSAADRAILAGGVTPSGLHIPNGAGR
jgi:hypothetical protein